MSEIRPQPVDALGGRVRELVELVRPHPHRGDLIAAGALPLTVALLLVNVRFDGRWGTGVTLVVTALGCALVLAMGVLAPLEGERPRPYQLVLQLSGLALLLVALMRLAQAFGVERPLDADGSAFWILAVLTGAAAWLARERRSAIGALVAGVAGSLALVAFVEWVFSPEGPGTARWILLLAALIAIAGALVLRDRRRRESVYLIDAAGVAVLMIGVTFVLDLVVGAQLGPFGRLVETPSPGAGWKLLLVAAGCGLIAYGGVDREPGPAWIGALVLLLFVALVGRPGAGGPNLWFWPLALLLLGAALIAIGLRPRRPLPPEPTPPGGPGTVVPGPPAPAPGGAGPTRADAAPDAGRSDDQPTRPQPEVADADRPTRPQAKVVDAADQPTRPHPTPEAEPPARGSLWARDLSEQPTRVDRPARRPSADDLDA